MLKNDIFDLSKFEDVVNKLRKREPLDAKYKDHSLSGNWKNHRDFHLHPDLVIIYCIKENELILETAGEERVFQLKSEPSESNPRQLSMVCRHHGLRSLRQR